MTARNREQDWHERQSGGDRGRMRYGDSDDMDDRNWERRRGTEEPSDWRRGSTMQGQGQGGWQWDREQGRYEGERRGWRPDQGTFDEGRGSWGSGGEMYESGRRGWGQDRGMNYPGQGNFEEGTMGRGGGMYGGPEGASYGGWGRGGQGQYDQGNFGGAYGQGAWNRGSGDWGQWQGPHAGRGPRSYQRTDDRIREDINERLTHHGGIDATEIEVGVRAGEVTLTGSVEDRQQKHMAEDVAESVSGVKEVQNSLRVQQRSHGDMSGSNRAASGDRAAQPNGTLASRA